MADIYVIADIYGTNIAAFTDHAAARREIAYQIAQKKYEVAELCIDKLTLLPAHYDRDPVEKTYIVRNENDGNDSFTVTVPEGVDPAGEALTALGWYITEAVSAISDNATNAEG